MIATAPPSSASALLAKPPAAAKDDLTSDEVRGRLAKFGPYATPNTTAAAAQGAEQALVARSVDAPGCDRSRTVAPQVRRGRHHRRSPEMRAEEFSFALAVVLTPAVLLKEGYRRWKAHEGPMMVAGNLFSIAQSSVVGMLFSFVAGLLAPRWLSRWLEHGRWQLFGCYCLLASVTVLAVDQLVR